MEIPADINVVAEYPIASVEDVDQPRGRPRRSSTSCSGTEGQAILAKYGFGQP